MSSALTFLHTLSARTTGRFHALLCCVLTAVLIPAAFAANVHGVVSHVTDGDSLWVRPASGGAPIQVRVLGIDAPEICQTFGRQAREALAARIMNRPIQVTVRTHDIYQRSVGRVTVDGRDIGAWLVSNGYAWSMHYQHRAGAYDAEEAQARSARRGLWAAGTPLEPRLFRKRHGSCHTQ